MHLANKAEKPYPVEQYTEPNMTSYSLSGLSSEIVAAGVPACLFLRKQKESLEVQRAEEILCG